MTATVRSTAGNTYWITVIDHRGRGTKVSSLSGRIYLDSLNKRSVVLTVSTSVNLFIDNGCAWCDVLTRSL